MTVPREARRRIERERRLRACYNCGELNDRRRMSTIDLSRDGEYYPDIRYLCATCQEGSA